MNSVFFWGGGDYIQRREMGARFIIKPEDRKRGNLQENTEYNWAREDVLIE
jgi:hypothetical protein